MRHRFAALVASLLVALTLGSHASAGMLLLGAGGSGVSYVGPGNIQSGWTAWYSPARAYSAAVAATGTQKTGDLRRASDNATCSPLIAASGSVDLTVGTPCAGQTVTAFCNATTCLFSKLYDQSGNLRDASQGTAGNQPQSVLSGGSNNLPYVRFSGSQWLTATTPSTALPVSFSTVAIRTGTFTSYNQIVATPGTSSPRFYFVNSANFVEMANSLFGLNTTATDSTWHALQTIINGASSAIYVDGNSAFTGNTGTGSTGTTMFLGAATGPTNPLTGGMEEFGLYAGSIGNVLAANQKAYYGTP